MKRTVLIVFWLLTVAGCGCPVRNRSTTDPKAAPIHSPETPAPGVNEPAKGVFDEFEAEFSQKSVKAPDPLEGWNRLMFQVNDGLYFWVFRPVAQAYQQVATPPVRKGVRNFFHNLSIPVRFVSCVLQGKDDDSGKEFGRFMVNSTWGLLGVADPAKDRLGLDVADDEDIGQTLSVHGAGHGFYIVWPILGPSTLRDSVGLVADHFLDPMSYVRPWETYVAARAFSTVNHTSLHRGEYETLKSSAIEPYTALRDAYLQYRARQIQH